MKIYSEFNKQKNLVVILGFFDGIHYGHKAVIQTAVNYAKERDLQTALVTFKDAPFVYFGKKEAKYILSKPEKEKMLENFGIDFLYELNFDEHLANLTASQYLETLVNNFKPSAIVTGYNHYFGYNKSGNADYLRLMQEKYGYKYLEVLQIKSKNGVVCSTKIREALNNGDIKLANSLLGYRFFIKNEVVKGAQIGRSIGFKTANLIFPNDVIEISNGVYAVEVEIDEKKYMGIANYGSKPTVKDDEKKLLEVHIINFDEDIYGKFIKVSFLDKIRDEKRFNSLTQLKEQITKDIECLES